MKGNKKEIQAFSDAIDQMNGGFEKIVDFYNDLEEDRPAIQLTDEVMAAVEKAKDQYGAEYVNEKINKFLLELLSWLPTEEKGRKKEKKN